MLLSRDFPLTLDLILLWLIVPSPWHLAPRCHVPVVLWLVGDGDGRSSSEIAVPRLLVLLKSALHAELRRLVLWINFTSVIKKNFSRLIFDTSVLSIHMDFYSYRRFQRFFFIIYLYSFAVRRQWSNEVMTTIFINVDPKSILFSSRYK